MGHNDFFYSPESSTKPPEEPPKPPPGLLLGMDGETPVYIPPEIRKNHLYIIGLPRHGKTDLMKYMMRQDAQQGNNFAFIDPHSDAAKEMLGLIPRERVDDVIYFDPADPKSPAFNPLRMPSSRTR